MIKQKTTGQLIVISGPSGAGKGTVISKLLENNKDLWLSISATSRKPRGKEKNGVEYYFLSEEDFIKKIDENYFLEYAKYQDNYYGTPKSTIVDKLKEGLDVVLEIEIQGAAKIKELIPEALFIFILPPTEKELLKRLIGRNTEDNAKIIKRFERAYKEINEVTKYNYVVVNDKVDEAVEKVKAIIKAEKCRVDRIEDITLANQEEIIHEAIINKKFKNKTIYENIKK